MKHQPFFTKLKKVLAYPFNLRFIKKQQRAIKLLSALYESYYGELQVRYNEEKSLACQEIFTLRSDLKKCLDLHDVTRLISVEISNVLKTAKINIQIFDLKTKWFLWQSIFLNVDHITDETAKTTAKTRLNILREISSIFDLGQ